ncbi:MAG TPA: hypothetical protein VGW12_14915 [Pyrinomonadaceae bacterium]|nr:hypothetical protein [Pyrinomonadaceae bacterium]
MDAQVTGAIIGGAATLLAALVGYLATHRKEKVSQREKWYTRWKFNRIHHEVLELKISESGAVSGTRTTAAEGDTAKIFKVTGHKQGSFYWLEYHLEEGRGGGAITLQEFTPGHLSGLVTSVACDGTVLQCRVNRWLPYEDRNSYDLDWFATVARVPIPASKTTVTD